MVQLEVHRVLAVDKRKGKETISSRMAARESLRSW